MNTLAPQTPDGARQGESAAHAPERHRPHGAPASGAELAEVHAELHALRTEVAQLTEALKR